MSKNELKATERELAMLRYQEVRYKTLGKGSICQQLHVKIQKLSNLIQSNEDMNPQTALAV